MQVIEVPVYNEDGSVNITQRISPEEAQHLLQFAINFMMAVGASQKVGVVPLDDEQPELND